MTRIDVARLKPGGEEQASVLLETATVRPGRTRLHPARRVPVGGRVDRRRDSQRVVSSGPVYTWRATRTSSGASQEDLAAGSPAIAWSVVKADRAAAASLAALFASMVSLTFVFLFPWCSHSEWTIERHHFEAEYRESLETIDDDLVVLLERLDGLFAAVVSWTVYVFVRVSSYWTAPLRSLPPTWSCCGVEPEDAPSLVSPNASKPHLLRWSRDGRVRH